MLIAADHLRLGWATPGRSVAQVARSLRGGEMLARRQLSDLAPATYVISCSEWKLLRADQTPLEAFD